MNYKHLPANRDARSDEEKALELLLQDAPILNEYRRNVAANEERRRMARLHKKWEKVA